MWRCYLMNAVYADKEEHVVLDKTLEEVSHIAP